MQIQDNACNLNNYNPTYYEMKLLGKVVILLFILSSFLYSEQLKESGNPIILNKEYYSSFKKLSPIKRDTFFDKTINNIIQGKGYIESVEEFGRYKRKYRIVLIAKEERNLNIRLFIFTNTVEYLQALKKGDIFQFNGQFVLYTPLNSKRDSYILDIILKDGSLLVE
ncbi:MAG: hypothetical protein SVR08_06860 [Spirochaetota bacterium]|nr:hypothetical protein [Spirochaetota bacterium]